MPPSTVEGAVLADGGQRDLTEVEPVGAVARLVALHVGAADVARPHVVRNEVLRWLGLRVQLETNDGGRSVHAQRTSRRGLRVRAHVQVPQPTIATPRIAGVVRAPAALPVVDGIHPHRADRPVGGNTGGERRCARRFGGTKGDGRGGSGEHCDHGRGAANSVGHVGLSSSSARCYRPMHIKG